MTVRVLLAGGGTGGHLYPALAIAEALKIKGADIRFVGTRQGLEARVVPDRGFLLNTVWLSGFHRRRILVNLLFPLKMIVSLWQSFRILRRFQPQAALGTGGYVCGPVLLIAALHRIPVFLQEQNSYPGVTTRLLARFSKEVFLNFREAASYLPAGTKWRHVGNPVRPEFKRLERAAAVEKWGLNPQMPTLLVFGGSQGAMSINRAVALALPKLGDVCNLIWSRGFLDQSEPVGWRGPGVLVVKPYIDDMPSAYAAADLAVCRSGAMTLSELQAAALPAILVPYPYAAGDHQKHNAETFARTGGARIIDNWDLSGEKLFAVVNELLDNPDELTRMKRALEKIPRHNAAEIIADEIMRVAAGA
jgi:UDP-N-acetylglucosamine--N-acetylmuramyl-(pentapeptide) pyrophosphoryl-undecaprenol N-acetylglucosamine transferase